MNTEVGAHASFSRLRYAQCWEDADILLDALEVRPSDVCLSVASAGDNALSLLSRGPERVIAVDISPVQLACVELRVAALRELDDAEIRRLVGSTVGDDRQRLYRRCRALLSPSVRQYWDARPGDIDAGIGDAGKFEAYFRMFRRYVLPLVHSRETVDTLVMPRSSEDRKRFYEDVWNNHRWRWMFRLFFSRFVMGRLGRDPSFFRYVEGSVAERILERTRHALAVLDPSQNPYVQWILFGRHHTALPHWLRTENLATIRTHLDRIEWREASIETFLDSRDVTNVSRFNLSDIFEYMSPGAHADTLRTIADRAAPGARLAYWNMLAPRRRPESLAERIHSLDDVGQALFAQDKAFFYSAFVVEEVACS